MSDIPMPFREEAPKYIEPPREEEYILCEECGERAWDPVGEFCGACHAYVPTADLSPEKRAEIRRQMDMANARAAMESGKCEGCTHPAAMRVTYPIYDDYSGKLLGEIGVDLCVPCFNERHDDDLTDEVYGKASSISYDV